MSGHYMDPNECLLRIRELVGAERIRARYRNGTLTSWEARELTGHIEALDDWCSRGGAMPTPWYREAAESSDLYTKLGTTTTVETAQLSAAEVLGSNWFDPMD